ncbi:MAG: MATE family efflux transporter [Candidatus Cloacimonetes bacterium]|jgi:putative MATE family efflux protein|nr:MATE family efflux transporter [Candidatus Cloacimonadota bacterium]MDD4231476.1 MATE family efflux transporter [Candidatus Cloacimonadota bacterium]MDD4687190.1 MATE family efflux transporter [Candidatus Cloacimonadota bacterium]MDY0299259.1 MATE family efflux transporter [Candidatus Cloacimonadaceae bacterium]
MKANKIYVLESMPVPRAIMNLAIPSVLSMLVNILYNLTDTFFIGKLNDPFQVAAVSVSLPLFMLQMAMAGVFGIGGGSYLSRLLGKKDYLAARNTLATSVFTSAAMSIVLAGFGIILIPTFTSLIGATGATLAHAQNYMLYILIGSPIIIMKFTLVQLLRSEGAAKEAMVGLFIGTGMNILLDPLFIFGFRMEVTGAAVATVLGNGCGLLYYLAFYIRKKSLVPLSFKHIKLQWSCYKEILMIGIPASLSQVMLSVGNTISYRLAAGYSDHHVASLGVASRVFTIPIFVFIGISIGIQALVGYTYGAKNYKRMKETIRTSVLISLSISALMTLLFALFPRELIMIFIKDQDIVNIGTLVLEAYVFAIPIAAISMIMMTSLQAMGKAFPALIVSLSRQGIMYIPSIIILNKLFAFNGLVFAMPLADLLTTILSSTMLLFILKRLKHIEPTVQSIDAVPVIES